MGDIVAASGLEKGTLYGHFSIQKELALLAFDCAWKDASDKRLRNVDSVSTAVNKLKLHIDKLCQRVEFSGWTPSFELRGRCVASTDKVALTKLLLVSGLSPSFLSGFDDHYSKRNH